ncbi:DUF3127 domain-containing protein [Sphingobacterium sp. UT-1RO-CII-1]|uniref:DUF3127 domain-containing protein n=1 Tax=Sphingobacterium sp. UT-1RO-CII-1 TaxID=2995225 RepID=UPI00227B622E|nr:DUF3127 domain-containing protein [Sphingobacterium sp. UT-1RO-CII-1]MCY4781688.1 DUF3127 domain-containing protein [Sphingobacterium sp. UT-1RO-CII-1]
MQLTGKVHEIGATQQVTESFKKRDLIVAYAENPQFVEYIRFEATQDRVSIFDNLIPGDEIEVSFNLRGRPWQNKEGVTTYFNSLVSWRVNKLQSDTTQATQPPVDINIDEPDDDLPF